MAARGTCQRAVVVSALALALMGCGALPAGRVTLRDVPTTKFNGCGIPPGRPTWANVTLIGGEPPFRGVWTINGKVDSTDPKRATPVPGGTRLEILVTLRGTGQTFGVREFNRHGLVATDSWTNGAMGSEICGADGKPEAKG